MTAFSLCARTASMAACSFSWESPFTWLKMTVPALASWSPKNSPKLRRCIRHFAASAIVTRPVISSLSGAASFTARTTSESLPTPDGSIKMRSGLYSASTLRSASPKSPTRLQQMQPEFISVTLMPAPSRKPPSTPISPNSFSISTSLSPVKASLMSFLMRVVLPAPRKPEKISTLVIFLSFFQNFARI